MAGSTLSVTIGTQVLSDGGDGDFLQLKTYSKVDTLIDFSPTSCIESIFKERLSFLNLEFES